MLFNWLFRKFIRMFVKEGNRYRARLIIHKVCWSVVAIDFITYIINFSVLHIFALIF